MSDDLLSPLLKRGHAVTDVGEGRSESFLEIARRIFLVAVTSITVWGLVTLTRWLCDIGFTSVMALFHGREGRIGWVLLLLALGASGLFRGFLARWKGWASAQGDGMGMALGNFHLTYEKEGDDPAPRYQKPTMAQALQKGAMTVLTVGPGGSGGLEAPAVVMGEALGAFWSRLFRLQSAYELRICQLAGISAGIATLLHAPFTGALFAAEVAYCGTFLYRKLAYSLLAGVLGYFLNNHVLGLSPLFRGFSEFPSCVFSLREYATACFIAVFFSAAAALLMTVVLRRGKQFFSLFSPLVRPMVGAFLTGIIAIVPWFFLNIPPEHVLSTGENTIIHIVNGTALQSFHVWWVLIVILICKTLTTAATLSSGGSVGMLIPSMVLGGISGAAGYTALSALGLSTGPSPLLAVASGIAAGLTAVAGVPLCSIAFVMEVFHAAFGPPAMVACAVCYLFYARITDHAGLWPSSRRSGAWLGLPGPGRGRNSRNHADRRTVSSGQ